MSGSGIPISNTGEESTSTLYKYAFFILGILLTFSIVLRMILLKRLRRRRLREELRSQTFDNYRQPHSFSNIPAYSVSDPAIQHSIVYRAFNYIYPVASPQAFGVISQRPFIGPLTFAETERRRQMREERRYHRMTMEEGYGLPEYNKTRQSGEIILEAGAQEEEFIGLQRLEDVHVREGRRGSISSAAA